MLFFLLTLLRIVFERVNKKKMNVMFLVNTNGPILSLKIDKKFESIILFCGSIGLIIKCIHPKPLPNYFYNINAMC